MISLEGTRIEIYISLSLVFTLVTGVEMQRDATHVFNGSGDLLSFFDYVNLGTALKSFGGEKKALALASRLEGAAFENYRRLESEEKKFDVIETSFKQECLRGASDRRQAVELRGQEVVSIRRACSGVRARCSKVGKTSVPGVYQHTCSYSSQGHIFGWFPEGVSGPAEKR